MRGVLSRCYFPFLSPTMVDLCLRCLFFHIDFGFVGYSRSLINLLKFIGCFLSVLR